MNVWTIGHSNHTMDRFIELLRASQIECLGDVRSSPFSRYVPHFSRSALASALKVAGIRYVFLGEELGGRPRDRSLYDADGHVLYSKVAESREFRTGVKRLRMGAEQYRLALMCSEADPCECHRRLLIARVLVAQGWTVTHLLPDGEDVSEADLVEGELAQPSFFEEDNVWRSTRSVLPDATLRGSSEH